MSKEIHELPYLKEKIDQLKTDGVYRKLPIHTDRVGATVQIDGREIVNLSSNNYLGLANHPRMIEKAVEATLKFGVGAGSVRPIIGNTELYEEMERKIAEYKKEEAAFVFQSGYNCNVGTIQAIVEAGDLVISDELNHASIIDGIKLTKADKAIYKHADVEDLERILKERRKDYRNVLIITDGVFSMDGDLAPLPQIVELAEKYDAMTFVDDAHGSGVLGENGRGTVDHFHLHGRVDFIIGTLSKGIGVIGGYVAGKQVMKDWLLHRGRPFLFSTALPPAVVASVIEAFNILNDTTEYTDKLWANAKYFKEKLGKLGFNTGVSETPITPVIIGDEAKSLEFSRELLKEGVMVSAIVFPTVPLGTGRLRCMVNAMHNESHLDKAVEAFEKVGKQLGII